MKAALLISFIFVSGFAQAQGPDCSSVALEAVKAVLSSTGSLKTRHLDQWSKAKVLPKSTTTTQVLDVTYSAGSDSDDYVDYEVSVRISKGVCDLVTGLNFVGEE